MCTVAILVANSIYTWTAYQYNVGQRFVSIHFYFFPNQADDSIGDNCYS